MASTPAIFVVLQTGGSSYEHYFHSFETEDAATRFVEAAEAQSYRCIGPERLELGEFVNLIFASRNVLMELKQKQYEKFNVVTALEEALSDIERKLC